MNEIRGTLGLGLVILAAVLVALIVFEPERIGRWAGQVEAAYEDAKD